jgi:hypothetical protein
LALALAAGAAAGISGAGATAPVTGTGTVTNCKFSGAAALAPPMKLANATVKMTISGTLTCSGGTGNGANVTGGTLTATETKVQNCTSLAASSAHKIYSSIVWKVKAGTPALANSAGILTKMTPTVKGNNVTVDISGTNTKGSFSAAAHNKVLLHGIVKETVPQLLTACGSATGLAKITLLSTSALKIS